MKCHYEVLEVSKSATDDEIRKSYRKLALRWHPDKNPERQAEAKEVFQLVQQAYEVLSDPQERAWYDKHRETILLGRGSDYKDDSLDVYEYFTTSCFSGYGDNPRGFYAVYAEVFKKIAAEDSEFDKNLDSDFEIPVFGDSKSDYDNVVHPFYAYWQSYSTKKTYSWLDEYDVRQAPNRRILRLVEKENKKIRDKARKERNEEVRALVAFVRKRDKRVVEHIKKMEQEAVEKEKKSQEMRRQQILKRQNEMKSYVENDWAKFSNLESELKDIEAGLAAEFQDDASDNESSDEEDLYNNLFCVACSKVFKTPKAFANHENSKKHRENVEALRLEMQEEEEEPPESDTEGDSWKEEYKRNLSANENGDTLDSVLTEGMSLKSSGSSILEDSEVEVVKPKKKEKRKQKKRLMVIPDSDLSDDSIHRDFNPITENLPPIKEKAKKMAKDLETKLAENEASGTDSEPAVSIESNRVESTDFVETDRNGRVIGAGNVNKKKKKKVSRTKGRQEGTEAKPTGSSVAQGDAPEDAKTVLRCEVCNTEFKSKNSLFKHLNTTGHAVPVPKSTDTPRAKARKSKK